LPFLATEPAPAKVVAEPVSAQTAKVDIPPDAVRHSAAVKHPHVQSHDQSTPKEAGKIRYINLNE